MPKPLNYSVVHAVVGQRMEAITLLVAIAPLLLMDPFLHRRTSTSVQSLKNRLAIESVLIRDGVTARIAAVDIVPGDIVLVTPAEMLPAMEYSSQPTTFRWKNPRSPARHIPSLNTLCR